MFRRIGLAAAVGLVAVSAAGAASVGHAFVEVSRTSFSVLYLDMGDVRPVGPELEFTFLEVDVRQTLVLTANGALPTDRKFEGGWSRGRIDCDWGVARPLDRTAWTGDPANTTGTLPLSAEPEFVQDGPEARLCKSGPIPHDAIQSEALAVQRADEEIGTSTAIPIAVRETSAPPEPTRPIVLAGGPRAFGLVATSPDDRAVFLDWSRLTRGGGLATVPTLWLMGPETRDGSRAVALRDMRFDCGAGTAEVVMQRLWSRNGHAFGASLGIQGPRTISGLPTIRRLWDAACNGQVPAKTFEDIGGALSGARQGWARPPSPEPRPIPPRAPAPVPVTPVPPRPPVIAGIDWVRKPTSEDLAKFYPGAARKAGIEGKSTIECSVTPQGYLVDCTIISETPAGAGFGQAHLKAARKFQVRPPTSGGLPVKGARLRNTLVWGLY